MNKDFEDLSKPGSRHRFNTEQVKSFVAKILKDIPSECRGIFDRVDSEFKNDELLIFEKNEGLEHIFKELRAFVSNVRCLKHSIDEYHEKDHENFIGGEESLNGRFYRKLMSSFIGLAESYGLYLERKNV